MSDRKTVEFCFDVICPYAYLASTQIEAVAERAGGTVKWVPVLLGGLYDFTKAPQGKAGSATSVMSPAKRKWSGRDMYYRASSLNVPIDLKVFAKRPKTLLVQRLLTAASEDIRGALAHDLYHAFWVRGEDVSLRPNLQKYADKYQMDLGVIDRDDVKQSLRDATERAAKGGAFGVPAMFINGELFWGVDRLDWVERTLSGSNELKLMRITNDSVLSSPSFRKKNVDVYLDFASPWSFCAFLRLQELEPYANVNIKPIFLGGLVHLHGYPNSTLTAPPVKQQYGGLELRRHFKHLGTKMKFNPHFPVNTLQAIRVALIDDRVIDCLFRATWQDGINIGDTKELIKVLNSNGFDGNQLVSRAKADKELKSRLMSNVKWCVDRGVFGVPTYVIDGDIERFIWGQDRMNWVVDVCCGWELPSRLPKNKL